MAQSTYATGLPQNGIFSGCWFETDTCVRGKRYVTVTQGDNREATHLTAFFVDFSIYGVASGTFWNQRYGSYTTHCPHKTRKFLT